MFGSFTYIIWLALFIGLPLLILAAVARRALWRRRRALAWTLLGAFVGGWAWDALAVRLGAWYYDPRNILGSWLGGLPVEEWLWIVGVTLLFGCITIVIEEPRTKNQEPAA
ncbi:MAG TPA: lycopene cyclase domain-containing protein [Roseiflexaceae bacterium]|nr:lycopene cyclase domain-containing protein [Roseiflexaceae bacterium]